MKAMKQVSLLLGILMASTAFAQNAVYYYERIAIVTNGQKTDAIGDGHYLAINQHGLYECDAHGSSLGRGFVKYVNSDNGYPLYQGKAYLGNNLSYMFTGDYSRLNIHLNRNLIYVYVRKNGPSSDMAQRAYHSDPVQPMPTEQVSPTNTTRQTQRYPCQLCHGTGRQIKSTYTGGRSEKKWCSECNAYVRLGHYHTRCSLCGGKGYTER